MDENTTLEDSPPPEYIWVNQSECFLNHEDNVTNPNGTLAFPEGSTLAAGTFAAFFSLFGFVMNLVTVVALLTSNKTRRQITTPFIVRDNTLNYL